MFADTLEGSFSRHGLELQVNGKEWDIWPQNDECTGAAGIPTALVGFDSVGYVDVTE
jgi:hypothetical protein